MNRRRAALVALLLVVAAQVLAAEPSAPQGSSARGRETYLKLGCDQCHGREAQGSPTTGPRLGPAPLPLAAFTLFIRKPRLQMPPYAELILSEADIADIYAYVGGRPQPVALDRLPD